ncbi:MAG: NifB/NifX family molybdenum-iron cluster-binding protein [Sedimentisphaerales bacterium]|nr:NifB/NifX family molybdenum-iron cluster-binding protein [Sedimentisphaerales bacterium]
MKIAIPLVNDKLCMHFGHCEVFALIDVDEESKSINSMERLTPPMHQPGVLPAWLHTQGANVIIAGGMGQRAQQLFAQNDIKVVVGAPSEPPESIVTAYLNDTLVPGENICDH